MITPYEKERFSFWIKQNLTKKPSTIHQVSALYETYRDWATTERGGMAMPIKQKTFVTLLKRFFNEQDQVHFFYRGSSQVEGLALSTSAEHLASHK